jgi:hypothetical protein
MFTYFGQFLVFLTPSQGLAQILATGMTELECVDTVFWHDLQRVIPNWYHGDERYRLLSMLFMCSDLQLLPSHAAMQALWSIFNGFMLPYPLVRHR